MAKEEIKEETAAAETAEMAEMKDTKAEKKVKKNKAADADPPKKYFKVRFHERQTPTEPVNVVLGINGEILVVKRGELVILPEEFVELARSCVLRCYFPVPEGQKTVRKKMTMPRCSFDLLGESTEAEYLKMKEEGTKKTIQDLNKNVKEE